MEVTAFYSLILCNVNVTLMLFVKAKDSEVKTYSCV